MADIPGMEGPMCDWPEIRVMPNAVAALSRLSQTARCHLATNARDSEPEQIRQALARGGLYTFIEHIFCYRKIGHAKPSAAYFDAVADRLGVERSALIMVGDDLEKDVLGAMQLGLQAVWYNPMRREVPNGVRMITDLMEITDLL